MNFERGKPKATAGCGESAEPARHQGALSSGPGVFGRRRIQPERVFVMALEGLSVRRRRDQMVVRERTLTRHWDVGKSNVPFRRGPEDYLAAQMGDATLVHPDISRHTGDRRAWRG
jgi:hypothetical protein